MKKLLAVLSAVALLLAAGCGGSHLASTPQAKQDAHAAEQIVQGCLSKGNPHAIMRCIAPPGHSAALERCVLHAATHDFIRKSKLVADLTKCVEQDR